MATNPEPPIDEAPPEEARSPDDRRRVRLAEADPAKRRVGLALPTWAISLVLHVAVVAALLFALPRLIKGLPEEDVDADVLEVGIVLKSRTPTATVFETENERFVDPAPVEARDQASLEPPQETPADQAEPNAPKLDESLLATAGNRAEDGAASLPPVPAPAGGGKSRTTFWKVEAVGSSFVFVIDRSASMSHRGALELAKRETLQSLERLGKEATFQIVFYNTDCRSIEGFGGGMIPASPRNLQKTRADLATVEAGGGTDHVKALLAAMDLSPEVVYFLTDADLMTDRQVAQLTRRNRSGSPPASVHCIEFGIGPELGDDKPLRRLAAENDGTYTYVNVQNFPAGPSLGNPSS